MTARIGRREEWAGGLSPNDLAFAMGQTVDIGMSVSRTLDWQRHAACSIDPSTADTFFPLGRPLKSVKEMCQHCPVVAECLAYAMDAELEGIWGGTTTKDREAMRHAS